MADYQVEQVSVEGLEEGVAQDIQALFTRQRGELLCIKDNRLAVFSGWNLRQRYRWTREERQESVRLVVSNAISALQRAIETRSPESQDGQKLQRVLKASFFKDHRGPIGRLSEKIFDRSLVTRGGVFEKFLASKEFFEAEQALKEKITESQGKPTQERKKIITGVFYRFCYQESVFANSLGLSYQRMGLGSGGACKGFARSGQTIVIRKAGDEGPYGVNNPSIWSLIKRLILSPRACLVGNSEPRAERSSHQLSEALGLDNVPPTYVEHLEEREYSVQLFVPDSRSLQEELNISSVWKIVPRCLRGVFRYHLQMRKAIHEQQEEDSPSPDLQEDATSTQQPSCWARWSRQIGKLRTKILKIIYLPLLDIPKNLFEQAAIAKFLSGDIDTHLENMLISSTEQAVSVLTENCSDPDVEAFVKRMYTQDSTHVSLLKALLQDEDGRIFVNHDGGAAFVHQHNREGGIDGYLSSRYRCLFEVLPVCSEPFGQAMREKFISNAEEQNKQMIKFVLAQGLQELIARFEQDLPVFTSFWSVQENRMLFKQWVLGTNQPDCLRQLCRKLTTIKFADSKQNRYAFPFYENNVEYNLELVRGTCTTLIDRYRLLMHHLQEKPGAPMRDLFILSDEDQIQEQLEKIEGKDSGFSTLLQAVAATPASDIDLLPSTFDELHNGCSEQVERLYGTTA